jgi:hypothetical protein
LCHADTNRAVEAVSGQSLEVYFREHIFEPLGMSDTGFLIGSKQRARTVRLYQKDDNGGMVVAPEGPLMPQNPEFFMGGGGLFSTAPDYDVARPKRRRQHLLDPRLEDGPVHGAVEDVGGNEAARSEAADERGALQVAVWDRAIQALAARATAVAAGHVGRSPVDRLWRSTIHEHQPRRALPALPRAPGDPLLGDVGPVLLRRPARLFLSVSPSRASVWCISPRLADRPCVASSQARSSFRVTSGRSATSAAINPWWSLSLSTCWLRCGRASVSPVELRRPNTL